MMPASIASSATSSLGSETKLGGEEMGHILSQPEKWRFSYLCTQGFPTRNRGAHETACVPEDSQTTQLTF